MRVHVSVMWLRETAAAAAYTHWRGGGQSQVSHGAQISKQLSQLRHNNREDQSHRTSDKGGTDITVVYRWDENMRKTQKVERVHYHGLVFLDVLVSFS